MAYLRDNNRCSNDRANLMAIVLTETNPDGEIETVVKSSITKPYP